MMSLLSRYSLAGLGHDGDEKADPAVHRDNGLQTHRIKARDMATTTK